MATLLSIRPAVWGSRLWLLASTVLLSSCTSLFFYPHKQILATPDKAGVAYEDISFNSRDGTRLSAWHLKSPIPRKGMVYFLHGNAENISTHFASVYWLPAQGYDVLMLDYRGYGNSEGEPQLPEIYEDIDAGFQWIRQHTSPDEKVYLLGQSIGAALGVYWLAHSAEAKERVDKVALDAPFSSFPRMIEDVMERHWLTWLLAEPVSWCFSSRYDPERAAPLLPGDLPILMFHSRDDQVVPFAQGEFLYQVLPENKIRVEIMGPHIATFEYPGNRQTLLMFLGE